MYSLQEIRKMYNQSQVELAEAAGTSQTVISLIESGCHKPRKRIRQQIQNVSGYQSVDWNKTYLAGRTKIYV